MARLSLYRWHKHVEVDIKLWRGYLCFGWVWKYVHRPFLYWSPDSLPIHERARGFFLRHTHG